MLERFVQENSLSLIAVKIMCWLLSDYMNYHRTENVKININ